MSATGIVSYMAKLEDSFVMKDLETFKTWPRTMEVWKSMFADYPGIAAEVFEAMFAVNGVPQRHLKDRIALHREEARHIQADQGDERGAEGPMMKKPRPITVNVDELLAVNKYEVDEESAHIELASDNYSELPAEECGASSCASARRPSTRRTPRGTAASTMQGAWSVEPAASPAREPSSGNGSTRRP